MAVKRPIKLQWAKGRKTALQFITDTSPQSGPSNNIGPKAAKWPINLC